MASAAPNDPLLSRRNPTPQMINGDVIAEPFAPTLEVECTDFEQSRNRQMHVCKMHPAGKPGDNIRIKLPNCLIRFVPNPGEKPKLKLQLDRIAHQDLIKMLGSIDQQYRQHVVDQGVFSGNDWRLYSSVIDSNPEKYQPLLSVTFHNYTTGYDKHTDPAGITHYTTVNGDVRKYLYSGATVGVLMQPRLVWKTGQSAGIQWGIEQIVFMSEAGGGEVKCVF